MQDLRGRGVTRRIFLAAAGAGVAVAALPNAAAAAAIANGTAGPPNLPDQIRVRDANGALVTVALEDYIKGVIATEMPPTWHPEALKAQAVAARSYVGAYLARHGYVCSTTECQVWNPANRRQRADEAVDATRGQVLTYKGGLIWAYYSSTCGGQTAPSTVPYCQPVRCWREGDTVPASLDLSSEAAAGQFWAGQTTLVSFCSGSPSFRWNWSASGADASAALERYLPIVSGVTPKMVDGVGRLRDASVASRGRSGKIAGLKIVADRGSWEVKPEGSIRSAMRPTAAAGALRSANFVLSVQRDGDVVSRVEGRGGGYGHGIGMCQFGAKGMAESGLNYQTILRHYYRDVEIVRA
jgi:stage II sporulation protein D